MATANDPIQRTKDAEEHRRSYKGIMKGSVEVGVPLTLGLTMFFTQLTMGSGWWAPVWFLATYVLVAFVVKTFFASH